jgi:hypothetical protein
MDNYFSLNVPVTSKKWHTQKLEAQTPDILKFL